MIEVSLVENNPSEVRRFPTSKKSSNYIFLSLNRFSHSSFLHSLLWACFMRAAYKRYIFSHFSSCLCYLRYHFVLFMLLSITYNAWKVSVFGVILVRISPHSDWIRENVDQKQSEYGHFLRSVRQVHVPFILIKL